ncbi:MAG: glycosyltransferase family 4 protein [Verrucomicrobia bacterium]|nr:glycosyltransferase family 4 protein [Verrucomicrobiota bacterium]
MRFLMLNWRDPKNPLAGGAERVTLEYLAELGRRGHEVFWFAYDFPGAAREETIDGVRIVRGGGMVSSIFAARKWFRQQPRFDLVMDQHHGLPWFAPWWCGTNNIAYIHEVLGPIWRAFYPWPISTIGRWQERWTHWFYRRVPFFTASSFTKQKLVEHGVRDVTIIPYGVHTNALPALPPKPLGEPLRLIVVSRLAPNKRIAHAIRAVHHLVHLGVRAELTVVGTGEEEKMLKELVNELQMQRSVHFTGLIDEAEKDELLRASHFLLHTSQREGWGLNVIEANAMGTPAAVYPVAGLIESTLHNETGLVAAEETPASLAEALRDGLRSPERYTQWRVQAWERAKTFHWSQVLPKAAEWFEAQARSPRC